MTDFKYHDRDTEVTFDPLDGFLELLDLGQVVSLTIPKGQAINLASKLLQWGTSS